MQISRGRPSRSAIVLGLAAALACCALVSSAVAAAPVRRSFTLVVSPKALLAGKTGKFFVGLTNTSSPGTPLGSARVSAPAGFKLRHVALPPGAQGVALIKHNRIVLRNISVPPGSTLQLRVMATAPLVCTPTPGSWHSTAWEGQFGGGTLHLQPRNSQTVGAVGCPFALRFTTQPTSAATGHPITGSPGNSSGPPVTVEVFNPNGALARVSTLVKITLSANPNGSTLGGTTVARTVNGVVRFNNLTLNKAGAGYALTASSPGLTSTTSHTFNENQTSSQNCASGQPCSTTLSTPNSGAFVGIGSGSGNATARESVDLGTSQNSNPGCSFYTPPPGSVDWYGVNVSATNRSKTITWTVNNADFTKFEVCFGANYPNDFQAVNSNGNIGPAPAGTLPDGSTGNVGILPTCGRLGGAASSNPCVSGISSTKDGKGTVVMIQIPAGLPGDPFFGH